MIADDFHWSLGEWPFISSRRFTGVEQSAAISVDCAPTDHILIANEDIHNSYIQIHCQWLLSRLFSLYCDLNIIISDGLITLTLYKCHHSVFVIVSLYYQHILAPVARYLLTMVLSVRPSVRTSHSWATPQDIEILFAPYDRAMSLVSWGQINFVVLSLGFHSDRVC